MKSGDSEVKEINPYTLTGIHRVKDVSQKEQTSKDISDHSSYVQKFLRKYT
jgi:hypothetical protein